MTSLVSTRLIPNASALFVGFLIVTAGCGKNLSIVDPVTAAAVRGQSTVATQPAAVRPGQPVAANTPQSNVDTVNPTTRGQTAANQPENGAPAPSTPSPSSGVAPAPDASATPASTAPVAATPLGVPEAAAPTPAPVAATPATEPFLGPLPATPPSAPVAEVPATPATEPAAPTQPPEPPVVASDGSAPAAESVQPDAPAPVAGVPGSPVVTTTEVAPMTPETPAPASPVAELPTPTVPTPVQALPAQLHTWLLESLASQFLTIPTEAGVYPSSNPTDYSEAVRWVYFSALRAIQPQSVQLAANCRLRDFISDFPASTMERARFNELRSSNGVALPYLIRARGHGRRLAVVPYARGVSRALRNSSMQLFSVDMSRLPARGDMIPGTLEVRLHSRVVRRAVAARTIPSDTEVLCSSDTQSCTGEFFTARGLQGHINDRFGAAQHTGRQSAMNPAFVEIVRKTLEANTTRVRRGAALQIPLFPADMRRIFTATGQEWTEAELMEYLYGHDRLRGRSLGFVLSDETSAVEFSLRVRALVRECQAQ